MSTHFMRIIVHLLCLCFLFTQCSCLSSIGISARRYEPGFHVEGFHSRNAQLGNIKANTFPYTASLDPVPEGMPAGVYSELLAPNDTSEFIKDSMPSSVSDSVAPMQRKGKYTGLKSASIAIGAAGLASMAIGDGIALGLNGTLGENTTKGMINGLLFIGLNLLGFVLLGIAAVLLGVYLWVKRKQ